MMSALETRRTILSSVFPGRASFTMGCSGTGVRIIRTLHSIQSHGGGRSVLAKAGRGEVANFVRAQNDVQRGHKVCETPCKRSVSWLCTWRIYPLLFSRSTLSISPSF